MLPPEAFTNRIGALTGASQAEGVAQEIEIARRTSRAESIGAALAGVAAVAIWIVAVFSIASVLGVDLAPLLAGAGIAGVALGFGAQSLVRDCISGLFILIEDQFGIGDQVDLGAASGTVERISLRTTVLRGADGTVWHVPNGEVRRVGNQSKLWSMAVVDVDIPVDADLNGRSRSPPGRRQPSVRATGVGRRRARAAACARRRVGPRRRCHAASRREVDARPPMGACNAPCARRSSRNSTPRHRPHDAAET